MCARLREIALDCGKLRSLCGLFFLNQRQAVKTQEVLVWQISARDGKMRSICPKHIRTRKQPEISARLKIKVYVFIFKYLYIYIYIHTYYITLHCITFRYNTIQWQYIYSTFTVQYTTQHNVTLHTYIPAKVHQIARTEVMVRNVQGQKSGVLFIQVKLSYTYL